MGIVLIKCLLTILVSLSADILEVISLMVDEAQLSVQKALMEVAYR